MAERTNAPVLKTGVVKATEGSNPSPSANWMPRDDVAVHRCVVPSEPPSSTRRSASRLTQRNRGSGLGRLGPCLATTSTDLAGHELSEISPEKVDQLKISPRSSATIAASRSRHACRASGVSRGQSATSPTTLSGSLERKERVRLPGKYFSVTFGSSSTAPVGSTMRTRGAPSPAASSAASPAPSTIEVKDTWFITTSGR